jgi:type VI secretion system secreted protein Hcp
MAEVAFCYIDGIEGECNKQGHTGAVEVRAFHHEVAKQVDPLDNSKVRSDRHHGSVTITTDLDKSFPLLMKALCNGETINQIKVEWYRQPAEGASEPEHYFTHTFSKCIITGVRPLMKSATEQGRTGHMFSFDFGYRQVTWTSETGGTEFLDEQRV